MGAWGYGSFDNDTAQDFLSELINWKKVRKLVSKKKIDHSDYDELRVTAEVVVQLYKLDSGIWTDQEVIDGLIAGLEQAINDKSWHDTWREEYGAKAIIKQLKKLVKQLKNLEGY